MSKIQHVHVTHDFASSPAEVFAVMGEHEDLGKIFPAKMRRVRDGDSERNGVGSVRSLKPFGLPPAFEETVTKSEPGRLIEYRISKGSPMTDHLGIIRFEPTAGGGTRLDYRIQFGSRIPGVARLVKAALQASLTKGLPKLVD